MRIVWKSHPTQPTKNGTVEHVAREFAAVAVGYGQAEYAPYKNYLEFLDGEEKLRQASLPRAAYPAPTWQVHKLPASNKLVVVRLHLTEKMIYQPSFIYDRGRPDFKATQKAFAALLRNVGCPEAVIKQWTATATEEGR